MSGKNQKPNKGLERERCFVGPVSATYAPLQVLLIAALSILLVPQALATETGTTHYAVGVNTLGDGYMPKPGTLELRNYTVFHWSHRQAGNSGEETVPGFRNTGSVNAMRFLYTFDQPIGPFHYTLGAAAPIVEYNNVKTDSSSDHATNLQDFDLQSYLSYHTRNKKLFLYFGLDVYAPTGKYNKNDLVNIGKNYWSFDPSINITYHVTDKLTLDLASYAEFNTKNHATHYQSGHLIDTDYGVSYQPFVHHSKSDFIQHLGFGINGYFLQQFTNDEIKGKTVEPNGNRARAFAIGPQVIYHTDFGAFALKWQHDLAVENRAASDAVWFQFAVPLLSRNGD